jgi:D-3-phosphoglycerate dehydrogenase
MMRGFRMNIRAYDPFLKVHGWPAGDVEPVENLVDALAWADAITVSAPKSDKPMLAQAEFDKMKDDVIIVNTSRGGIVDEAALVAALRSGKVGAAGLDVFETEPLANDSPLREFDQVILSPHIAGVTEGASERMAIGSAQNIIDFFDNMIDPSLVVNWQSLAHV